MILSLLAGEVKKGILYTMLLYKNALFILITLLFFGSILSDQWLSKQQLQYLHIIGWENHILIKLEQTNQFFLWGKQDQETDVFIKSLFPFGSKPIPPIQLQSETNILQRTISDTSFLLFPKDFILDIQDLPQTKLKTDWWIMEKTFVPKQFPLPKQGILFLGSHRPGKSLITFAQKNNLPLISVYDTNTFWMKEKEGKWSIKVQE